MARRILIGLCFICGKQIFDYKPVPKPTPHDYDCGGNCWECQLTFESSR